MNEEEEAATTCGLWNGERCTGPDDWACMFICTCNKGVPVGSEERATRTSYFHGYMSLPASDPRGRHH